MSKKRINNSIDFSILKNRSQVIYLEYIILIIFFPFVESFRTIILELIIS